MSKKDPQSAPDFTGDEHWGKGGQYVVVDGKRVPAPVEQEASAAPAKQPATPATKGN